MQPTIDIVVLHLGCTRDRAAPQMASLSAAIATLDAFKKSAPAIARALCFGQSLMIRERERWWLMTKRELKWPKAASHISWNSDHFNIIS